MFSHRYSTSTYAYPIDTLNPCEIGFVGIVVVSINRPVNRTMGSSTVWSEPGWRKLSAVSWIWVDHSLTC